MSEHAVVFRDNRNTVYRSAPMEVSTAKSYAAAKAIRGYTIEFDPPLPAESQTAGQTLKKIWRKTLGKPNA